MCNVQVNTSGQFVGLAEMVGPVDFQKNVEYWQQDKWNGNFPVKWHMVKDVPNSLLKLIILENNENKPVTNSRDTQEVCRMYVGYECYLVFLSPFPLLKYLFNLGLVQVKLEQGLEMLKIFKEHTSKTCILDDFGFYEVRQKTIQEKKAKQQQFHKQVWVLLLVKLSVFQLIVRFCCIFKQALFGIQVWEGKNSGDKNKDGKEQVHKSVEVGLDLSKGVESNGDSDTGV